MRILCTICTELFDDSSDVSVVPCGHLFHGDCLSRWLSHSMTCPQCRNHVTYRSIIHKLFFNQGDGPCNSSELDVNHLENELDNIRLTLRQKDTEIKTLGLVKTELEGRVEEFKENMRTLESLRQQELQQNKTLKQELSDYNRVKQELNKVKQEAVTVRQKLSVLQNVQSVINGCEDDISEMIRGTADINQLATWCCVYKGELERKRSECRKLSEECRQSKKEVESLRASVNSLSQELATSRDKIKNLEEDIAGQDVQIISLTNKIEALEAAVASPSATSLSYARRMLHESPAPLFDSSKRPKLSYSHVMDLNDSSADLFSSSPAVPSNFSSKENITSVKPAKTHKSVDLNLISASTSTISAARQQRRDELDNPQLPLSLNIMKNRQHAAVGRPTSSVFRKGYNGFGGHETFITPLHRPSIHKNSLKKQTVLKPSLPSHTLPSLPSLDNF